MPSFFRQSLRQKAKQYVMTNVEDFLTPFFWVEVVVEFILCTFILTIVIWALTTLNEAAFRPTPTHFGLFAGFSIMALIEGYGPLCGALMNPAGAWGFFVAGRISLVRALLYMAAEIAGAAAGGLIGISLTPTRQAQEFSPILPGHGITAGMGMTIEGILTFNLLVVALSCTNPKTKTSIMCSFPIAFCVGIGIMAAGTHIGGLQNPIVPFGTAVATKNFTMHFQVYWAGPFIGATVGAIFYNVVTTARTFFDRHRGSHESETEDESIKSSSYNSEKQNHDDGLCAIHL